MVLLLSLLHIFIDVTEFFVFFSCSSRSQQGKPRTDAESVGRGNVNFFTEFYLSFLRNKDAVDVARLFQKKTFEKRLKGLILTLT